MRGMRRNAPPQPNEVNLAPGRRLIPQSCFSFRYHPEAANTIRSRIKTPCSFWRNPWICGASAIEIDQIVGFEPGPVSSFLFSGPTTFGLAKVEDVTVAAPVGVSDREFGTPDGECAPAWES